MDTISRELGDFLGSPPAKSILLRQWHGKDVTMKYLSLCDVSAAGMSCPPRTMAAGIEADAYCPVGILDSNSPVLYGEGLRLPFA